MKFALYNSEGVISFPGECTDGYEHLQSVDGLSVYIGEAYEYDSINMETGELVPGIKPPPQHWELRNYPPVEQQLDALWHAMNEGEIPKATVFYEGIKAIKDAHPRPEPVNPAYLMPEE